MHALTAERSFHAEIVYSGPIPSPLSRLAGIAPTSSRARYLYLVRDGSGLLYIGMTWNPEVRLAAHRKRGAPWWSRQNRLVILRHEFDGWGYNVDEEIREIERSAIAGLNPIYNIDRSRPTGHLAGVI